jgi:hypothetical protein
VEVRSLQVLRTSELEPPPSAGSGFCVRTVAPVGGLAALDALPARLDVPLLFPAPNGGLLNLDNFRRREWGPAVEASGMSTPARIYALRSTFASDALAAGVSVFQLARIWARRCG